jgi:hypothetical protein
MRRLKADLLRLKPAALTGSYTAASLPNFVGRETELAELKKRLSRPGSLVPIIGMPGVGKTYLAREFIRRHGALFEAVYELDCQQKDLAALTGELAMKLGLRLEGEAPQVAAELRQHLSTKRCLLLLDNVDDEQPGELVPGGRAAVLVTSRSGSIPFLAEYSDLIPPLFSDEEALDLFRRVLGAFPESAARQLFQRLGHLPIAISVAAGLIEHDLRYTVESLASLPPLASLAVGKNHVGQLLTDAIGALGENERNLLAALASCAPAGTRLAFAANVAQLSEPDALNALQGLYSRSLIIELDRPLRRYRLHPLIREAAPVSQRQRTRHAELVRRHLQALKQDPLRAAE